MKGMRNQFFAFGGADAYPIIAFFFFLIFPSLVIITLKFYKVRLSNSSPSKGV